LTFLLLPEEAVAVFKRAAAAVRAAIVNLLLKP
jgi:hypothetical protein